MPPDRGIQDWKELEGDALITQEHLKQLLHYDPLNGVFYWLKSGRKAGCTDRSRGGYRYIRLQGRSRREHLLAWVYVYGAPPSLELDHINGDKTDNRITNLREATRSQNNLNKGTGATNRSGFKGVFLCKTTNRYRAQAKLNGKKVCLGRHDTPEAAAAAYRKFAKENHGDFINLG